jgi:hypothetical protein
VISELNWRIKLVIAAWLIAAIFGALTVRNLMLGGWKDLPLALTLLLPLVLLLCSSSYQLLRGVRKNSK